MVPLPPILKSDGRSARNPEEVGAALGLSGCTVRKAVREGTILGTRIGIRTVIPLHEVARLLGYRSDPDTLGAVEPLVPAGAGAEQLAEML
jgi:hypothetical protein